MMKFALIVFFAVLLQVISVPAVYTEGGEGKCIKGKWHKASPSPETDAFTTCHAFKDNSCCTAEFTVELMANETRNLYNHSWHRCGQLSAKCQQFWITQECFYQCSPKVYKWKHPSFEGALKNVPVCSETCDQWFEACKDDQICVENVLEDYNFTVHGENFCPANKTCITYQAMYSNGKNLCEKMWAGSYKYTIPDAYYSNCLMMDGSSKPVKPTVESEEEKDKCIKGKWHKDSPSPETDAFKTCHAFKDNSCCTAEFTVELMASETRNLYNHSWHRCGQLSEKCQQFWITQECFYQCSPKVYKWRDPVFAGALRNVPVCSETCDQWFEACKDDQICVENVLEDYNFTVHGENFCPVNKTCITYQAMYSNGKNLCEKMWAGSYKYTIPYSNYSNCLMMDGSSKPVKPTVESEGVINTAYVALLQLLLFVVAVML